MKRLFVVLDLSLLRQPEEEQRQAVLRQFTTALGRLWAAYLHEGPGASGAGGRRNSWGYLLYDSACAELILKPVLRSTAQTLRLPVGFQETMQTDCRGAQLVQLVALVDAVSAHPPAGDSPASGPAREAPAAALSRALQNALSCGYMQKLRELAEDESGSGSTARAQGLLAAFTPRCDSAEQLQGWLGRAGGSRGDVSQLQTRLLDTALPAALWQRSSSGCLGLCWVPATECHTQPEAMQELVRQRYSNAVVAPLAQLAGPSSWAEFAARLALPVPHAEVGPRRRGAAGDGGGWMDAAHPEHDALDHLKLAVAELEGHSERALEEAKRQARAEHRQLARKRQGLPPQAARRGAAPAAKKGEALLENARRAAADKSRNPSRPTSVQGTPIGAAAASDDQHNVLAAAAAAVAGAADRNEDEGEVESMPALAPEAAIADLKSRVAELVASLAAAQEQPPTQDVLARIQALVRTTFLAARSYGQRLHPGAGSGGGSPAAGGSAPEQPAAQDPLSEQGLRALLLQQVPAAVADLRRQHSKSEEPWQRVQLAQRLLVELLLRLCICAWGARPGSSLPPSQYCEVEVLMQCLVATLQPIPQAGHDLFSGTVAGAFGPLFPEDVARLQDELWEPDFDPDFDQMLQEHRNQGAEREETGETPNCSTGQVASGAGGPARRPQRQSSSVLTGGRSGAAGGGAGPSNLGRAVLGQKNASGREGNTSSRPSAGTARRASSELSGEHSGVQGGASGATTAGATARSGAAAARTATSRDDLINLSHIRQRYNNTRQFELQVRSKLPPALAQTRKLKNAVATSRPMPLKVAGAASRGGASATARQLPQPQQRQREAALEKHQQVPATPDSRGKALLQAAAAAVERRRDQQQQQQQASALAGAVVSPDDAPVLPRSRKTAEPGRADEVPETAARAQPDAALEAGPQLMRGASLRLDFGSAPQFPGSLLASQPEADGGDGQPPADGTAPGSQAAMTWMVAATRVGRGAARAPAAAEFGAAAAEEESQPLPQAAAGGLEQAGSEAEATTVPSEPPPGASEPDAGCARAEEGPGDDEEEAGSTALPLEPSAAALGAPASQDQAAAMVELQPTQRETRSRGRAAPRAEAGGEAGAGGEARERSKSGGRATPRASSRGRGNPAAATPAGPPQGHEQAGAGSADGGTLRRSRRHTAELPADAQRQGAEEEGHDVQVAAAMSSRRRSGLAAVQAAQASKPDGEEGSVPEPPSAAARSSKRRARSSAAAAAEAEAGVPGEQKKTAAAHAGAVCPKPASAGKRPSCRAVLPPPDQAAVAAARPDAQHATALRAEEAAESPAAAERRRGTSKRAWPWKLGCGRCRQAPKGCAECRQTVKAQLKEAGLAGVLHVVTIECGSDCTRGGEHPGCTLCWTAVVQLLKNAVVDAAGGSKPVRLECAAAPELAVSGANAAARAHAEQAREAEVAACDGAEPLPPARSGTANDGQPGLQATQQVPPRSRSRPRRSQAGASLSQQHTADAAAQDAAAGAVSRGRGAKRQAPNAEPPAAPADAAGELPAAPGVAVFAVPGHKRRRTRRSGPQPRQVAAEEEAGQHGAKRQPGPVEAETAEGASSPGIAAASQSRQHQHEQAAVPPTQPRRSSRGRELEAGGGGLRRGRSAGTPLQTDPSQDAASAGAAGKHPQSRSKSARGRAASKGKKGAADASPAAPVALAAAAVADAAVADAEASIMAAASMHSLPAVEAEPKGAPPVAEEPQVLAPPAAAAQKPVQAGAAQPPALPAQQQGPEDREVQAALLSVGCLASQLDGGGDSDGEGAVSQRGAAPGSCSVSDTALANLTAEQLLQAQVVGMDGGGASPVREAAACAPPCGQAAAGAVEATPGQASAQALEQAGQSQEASGHPKRRRPSSAGGFKGSKGRLAAMHSSGKARKRAAAAEVTSSGGPKRRAPSGGGGSRSPLPQLAQRVAAASEGAAATPASPYGGHYAFLEGAEAAAASLEAVEAGAVEAAAEVVAGFSPAAAPLPSAAAPVELGPPLPAAVPDAASPARPASVGDARVVAPADVQEFAADFGAGAVTAADGAAAAPPGSPGEGAEASSLRDARAEAAPEDSPPLQAQRAQHSPVLSAATRGPAPSSSLDPRALARASQLQQQVSAQLTARKAGRPGRDDGNPQPGQQQRRQGEQPGSPSDSCLDSAVPDSQLQRLSPLEAAAGGGPQPPQPLAQPTPQSRQQRRLSPAGAHGKHQQLAAPRLAEQAVPRPCAGDRLLFGCTDLTRSELEVAEVQICQQLPSGFRLHIIARLLLEGLKAAPPLLHVQLDSASWVPPGQEVARRDHWQLLPRQAAPPSSSARPGPAPLPRAVAPGETTRHNTAARQQQRRLSTDSLVLPQSAAQHRGLLAALGGGGQQAPAPVAATLPKQLDFGCGQAVPAKQPCPEAGSLPLPDLLAAAAAGANITPRRLPRLTDFAQQRFGAGSPARPMHVAASLAAAAPLPDPRLHHHGQHAPQPQQAQPAGGPVPDGDDDFDPNELAAALPHAPPEVAALGARLCADLFDKRRGLVLPLWVLRPEDELHPGYVVTLCRKERSGLPLVQELLLLKVQRRAGSSPKKHSHSVAAMVLGEGLGSNVQPCRSLRVETAELKAAGLQVKAAGVRASGHWHACRQLASAASADYVFNRLESALATIRRHQQQQEQDDSE